MSAESLPISSDRFARALESLSVSSLHAKAAELRNNIVHLEKSNAELEDFVRQDQDRDLYEAILENREVIKRMEERIELLKKEVTEVRCLPWEPEGAKASEMGERERSVGNGAGSAMNGVIDEEDEVEAPQAREQGRRSPVNGAPSGDGEEGVFL